MALLGMESWDVYGIDQVAHFFNVLGGLPGSTTGITPGAGRCGDAALWNTTVGAGPIMAANPATPWHGYAGWAHKLGTMTQSFSLFGVNYTGPYEYYHFSLVVTDAGKFQFWNGMAGLIGLMVETTEGGLVHADEWFHLGVEWFIDLTAGYLKLYLNGLLILEFHGRVMTSLVPVWTGPLPWDKINWQPHGYIDDLYWGDLSGPAPQNAFMGDLKIYGQNCLTDAAGGGGSFRDWTPSTGLDHGALLDNNPPIPAENVAALGIGLRETVRFAPLPIPVGTIYGVQVMPYAVKDGTGVKSVAALNLSGSGVLSEGQTVALGAGGTYTYGIPGIGPTHIWERNPATGAAWTVADVNAAQAGVVVKA